MVCRYKVTGGLYPHVKDKVCLFRLGWISAQDYKCFVYAPMPPKYQTGMIFDSQVVFEGKVPFLRLKKMFISYVLPTGTT